MNTATPAPVSEIGPSEAAALYEMIKHEGTLRFDFRYDDRLYVPAAPWPLGDGTVVGLKINGRHDEFAVAYGEDVRLGLTLAEAYPDADFESDDTGLINILCGGDPNDYKVDQEDEEDEDDDES